MPTISINLDMVTITCTCGFVFAVPADFRTSRYDDHKTFYCPRGCCQHYPQESDAERLRRQVNRLTAQLDQETAESGSLRRKLSRTQSRISKGVCPCCKQSFMNLKGHMANKHPSYGTKKT